LGGRAEEARNPKFSRKPRNQGRGRTTNKKRPPKNTTGANCLSKDKGGGPKRGSNLLREKIPIPCELESEEGRVLS